MLAVYLDDYQHAFILFDNASTAAETKEIQQLMYGCKLTTPCSKPTLIKNHYI